MIIKKYIKYPTTLGLNTIQRELKFLRCPLRPRSQTSKMKINYGIEYQKRYSLGMVVFFFSIDMVIMTSIKLRNYEK